jgi:C4-dicarboxylate-specific signal transduction histidine kinase
LGLALSREAVTGQGGKLTVANSELGGAHFEARMPNVAKYLPLGG